MNFNTYQYLIKYSIAKPGALKVYKNAIKNQYKTSEELFELTWKKTINLLHEAFENVPFYRERFNAIGLHPSDITEPEHFSNVPVLTRQDLIDNFRKFISDKATLSRLKISTTGGSTGTPVKVGMSRYGIRELQKWQMLSWWGLTPCDNMASIYRGLPVKGINKIALSLINWPQKVIRMDATNMTRANIKKFIEHYNRYKPQLIHGYVGAIDVISDYILDNNIEIPAPRVIWATASPLSSIQEEKISRAFNSPVCDQYGCSERYFIAAECPHKNGLHIFSDSVMVEFLDDKNYPIEKGKIGKLVFTNLDEYHFPLIRYENGDYSRLLNKKCSCGLSLPLMDRVKGRTSDNLMLPDGTILAGEYLTTIFDEYTNEIKQFQVIQHSNLDITINVVFHPIVKNPQFIISKVESDLQSRIKNQVILSFEIKNKISPIDGKLKFIVRQTK